ncbi:MAG TPA: AAA family ATPase [Actinomycetota bacterium]|nr:AAA family ATPase [Actinomycetota bacterium]
MVKELFHASADERRAHLLSVVGIAGIGKSRLAWEFYKYLDGIATLVLWHRGRCPAYGEGITYWALAEMVRMRARIAEGEDPASARASLAACLEEHLPDPEERRFVEPRLAHLLGLEDLAVNDPQELFPAWRLFFERLAERHPAVLVFEDMQWADGGLLAFVEYLLEWSRGHPLFVVTLARPELGERFPSWGAGRRNFTSLTLEPLTPEAMEALVRGLVPGLPEPLRRDVVARAEGVPLYAVETVRMLLDRGLLVEEGGRYRAVGPVETLEVPETLHALIAARLDGLAPAERKVVQDASLVGKTFTAEALAELSGLSVAELEPLLTSLVRKEVFGVQADPRSPERGQYGFLQDLVRRVAYETLSKRERKARHLAVARRLEAAGSSEEEELVQIAASHYLEAYRLAPDAPDAAEVRARARRALVRAGQRAASLAAPDRARSYFEEALALTDDPMERAELAERAGQAALGAGREELAAAHFEEAVRTFEAAGRLHHAARASARRAEVLWRRGELDRALQEMEAAFAVLGSEEPDQDLAALAAQLARLHYFRGHLDRASERLEHALDVAESLAIPEVLSQALNTKWLVLSARGRYEEGTALLRRALDIALEHELPEAALRAYNNLSVAMAERDRYEEAVTHARDGLALARRVGNRFWEVILLSQTIDALWGLGRWDEALAAADELPSPDEIPSDAAASPRILLHAGRGELDRARELLRARSARRDSSDVQDRSIYFTLEAEVLAASGRYAESLAAAERALEGRELLGLSHPWLRLALVRAAEASLALGDLDRVEGILALVEGERPGRVPTFLRGQAARFRALLGARRGQDDVEEGFRAAAALFREVGLPLWLGVTLLEHGEWMQAQGRADEARPLLQEARGIFERLGAPPLLRRLEQLTGTSVPA